MLVYYGKSISHNHIHEKSNPPQILYKILFYFLLSSENIFVIAMITFKPFVEEKLEIIPGGWVTIVLNPLKFES